MVFCCAQLSLYLPVKVRCFCDAGVDSVKRLQVYFTSRTDPNSYKIHKYEFSTSLYKFPLQATVLFSQCCFVELKFYNYQGKVHCSFFIELTPGNPAQVFFSDSFLFIVLPNMPARFGHYMDFIGRKKFHISEYRIQFNAIPLTYQLYILSNKSLYFFN